ncbi:dabb-domain-containing protein [Heliocybe sulcata]|uniref:Dabb-domain-containing protein n=1 Tax=Heliocybe sulcata TaxID=5364 RepID=A0A5C3N6Y9_9AGAM|nr:dabb-domain-containing protein [Heliocybe sulcata]
MVVYHIVLVKFQPGVTEETKKAWREMASQLPSQVPQIKKLEQGKKIPHPFDAGWEDGVVFHFDNEADLKAYFPHPDHQAYLKACAAILADRICFDLEV